MHDDLDALLAEVRDNLKDRAFAQVVGARFEGEAKDSDALGAGFYRHARRAFDLLAIGHAEVFDQRQRDALFLGDMGHGPHLFGQAGAAIGKAGLEVIGRQVQLGVLAEDVHDIMAVDVQRLGKPTHFVGKADFGRVPDVVDIFDHLGGRDRSRDRVCVNRQIDFVQDVCRPVASRANHRLGRSVKVGHGHTFAQEFGVKGHAEINAEFLARDALKDRRHDLHRRPRRDRAPHDKNVEARLLRQALGHRTGSGFDETIVTAAVGRRGCADRYESHVGVANGKGQIIRCRDQTGVDAFAKKLAEVLLVDGRAACGYVFDLAHVDVHADDTMAQAGKAGGRNRADIAKADDRDRDLFSGGIDGLDMSRREVEWAKIQHVMYLSRELNVSLNAV